MTIDQTRTAIATHGPMAVYDAASNHIAGNRTLPLVGLSAGTLGDVYRIMDEACDAMSTVEVRQADRATRRALGTISSARHGLRSSLAIDSRTA